MICLFFEKFVLIPNLWTTVL